MTRIQELESAIANCMSLKETHDKWIETYTKLLNELENELHCELEKQKIVSYTVGNLFLRTYILDSSCGFSEDKLLLVYVGNESCCLIDVQTGMRCNNPVHVKNLCKISQYELDRMIGYGTLKQIENPFGNKVGNNFVSMPIC